MPAAEIAALYEEDGPKIFDRSALVKMITSAGGLDERYDDDGLVASCAATSATRGWATPPCPSLITAYDLEARQAMLLRSATDASAWSTPRTPPRRRRRTSSPCALGARTLIDGGVFAINPALFAYAEAAATSTCSLSLGTGAHTRRCPTTTSRTGAGWSGPSRSSTSCSTAPPTPSTRSSHALAGDRYVRLQTRLDEASDDLDDASEENLAALRREAERLIAARDADIDGVCAPRVSSERARSRAAVMVRAVEAAAHRRSTPAGAVRRHQPRACARPRSVTTSRGPATGSGARCTRPASRRGCCARGGRDAPGVRARDHQHSARPTRAASELSSEELREGAAALERVVAELQPRLVAIVGVTAYRTAFGRRNAKLGLQHDTIGGRPVWILPNTSGLNAHHTPADFARLFAEAPGLHSAAVRRSSLIIFTALLLAGCGGNDEKQVRATLDAYDRAFASGDRTTACALMTEAAQRELLRYDPSGCGAASTPEPGEFGVSEAAIIYESGDLQRIDIDGDTAGPLRPLGHDPAQGRRPLAHRLR